MSGYAEGIRQVSSPAAHHVDALDAEDCGDVVGCLLALDLHAQHDFLVRELPIIGAAHSAVAGDSGRAENPPLTDGSEP